MQNFIIRFILYTVLVLGYTTNLRAQSVSSLDIYVSNHLTQPPVSNIDPSGNQFSNLTAAFDFVRNQHSPISQANIFIAPDTEPYQLSNTSYILESNYVSNITISLWIDENEDQAQNLFATIAIIDLVGSTLEVKGLTLFTISNLTILGGSNSLVLNNSSLSLQNLSIRTTSTLESAVIKVQDGVNVELVNLNVNLNESSYLLHYVESNSSNGSLIFLQNISVLLTQDSKPQGKLSLPPVFNFTSDKDELAGKILIQDFEITYIAQNPAVELQPVLFIKNIESASISGINLNNQTLIGSFESLITIEKADSVEITKLIIGYNTINTTSSFSLITVNNTESLILEEVELLSNNLSIVQDSILTVVEIYSIGNIEFRSHVLSQNSIAGDVTLCSLSINDELKPLLVASKTSLLIDKVEVSNNKDSNSYSFFSYIESRNTDFKNLTITNFNFTMNSIFASVFNFDEIPSPTSSPFTLDQTATLMNMTNISLSYNFEGSNVNFLFLNPTDDQEEKFGCLKPVESYFLSIKNLTVENNEFSLNSQTHKINSQVSLFQVKQTQVHIDLSNINNNIFEEYYFFMLGPKASTIVITSSNITRNILTSSQLITNTLSQGYACSYIGGGYQTVKIPLYRYSFIIDSDFSGNMLDSSVVLALNNGFVAIHNSSFDQTSFTKSSLLTVSFSAFQAYKTGLDPLVYSRNKSIEDLTLRYIAPAASIFKEVMAKSSSYKSDSVYFTSLYNNSFKGIGGSSIFQYISLSMADIDQSFINIENNQFSFLTFEQVYAPPTVINCESVETMLIINNSFLDIQQMPILFSLSQSNSSKLLKVDSNFAQISNIDTFIKHKADSIELFEFSNNYFDAVTIMTGLILLDVRITSQDWILNNNTFSAIEYTLSPASYQSDQYGLITLLCSSILNQTSIMLNNSLFDSLVISSGDSTYPQLAQGNLMIFNTKQNVHFSNVTIQFATISCYGSLIQVLNSSSFSLTDSNFTEINSQGPNALITLLSSDVLISNTQATSIMSQNENAVFTVVSATPSSAIRVLDSSFGSFSTKGSGSVLATKTLQNFYSLDNGDPQEIQHLLNFEMTRCNISNSNFAIQLSNSDCNNCSMQDLKVELAYSGFMNLTNQMSGNFLIKDIVLNDTAYGSLESFLTITNSEINVTMDNITYLAEIVYSPTLATLDSGILLLQNSVFRDLQIKQFAPLIQAIENPITMNNEHIVLPSITVHTVHFINISGPPPLIDNFDEGYLNLPKEFDGEISSPFIFILAEADVLIQNCTFQDISEIPAVIYDVTAQVSFEGIFIMRSSITIKDSTFKNLNYKVGPALNVIPLAQNYDVVYDITILIVNSIFEDNFADLGGAIFVYNASLNILDSNFKNNSATKAGNCIFLGGTAESKTTILNTTFSGSYQPSKNDIGYEATGFNVTYYSNNPTDIILESVKDKTGLVLNLYNVSSKIREGYFHLDFINLRGDPALILSTQSSLTFSAGFNADYNISTDFDLTEDATTIFNNQTYILKDLTIAGQGNESVPISLTYTSSRNYISVSITAHIKSCSFGEYNNSGVCEQCPAETYSLNSSQPCKDCPHNAKCPDQSQICPIKDFWNPDPLSVSLYPCLPDRCLHTSGCGTCAPGYTGPLCNGCDFKASYVEKGFLKCGECENPHESLVLAILFAILYFLYQMFSIYILYAAVKSGISKEPEYLVLRKTERSYYIKSLLTYTQLMSILYLSSYDIYNSLGLTLQTGNPSSLIIYGTQCSMTALGVQSEDFLYYQTLILIVSPVVQFFIICLLTLLLGIIRPTINRTRIIGITALYLIISNQPGIVNNLSQFLSCDTKKDLGYNYVVSHPNWSCDTDRYKSFAQFIVIPSLVVWCGVVPVFLLMILFANHKRRGTEKSKGTLKVLMSGLQDKYYFWGIVMMGLKLSLSLLVYGFEQKGQGQIFLSLVLLWTYQSLVRFLKPYKNPAFNTFEIILINLLMLNIIVTQYLLDPTNGITVTTGSLLVDGLLNGGLVLYMAWKVLSLSYIGILGFIERRVMKREISRGQTLLTDSDPRFGVQKESYSSAESS